MDNATKIDDYLKEISVKVNTNFALINRVCALVDSEKRRWVIEVPEQSDFVVFFAPLFVIPEHKRDQGNEFLLKRNIHGNENRGTWLALHPNTNEVTLVYTHIVEMLTCQLFENVLTQFVEFSKEMSEMLQNEILRGNTGGNGGGSAIGPDSALPYPQGDFSQLA